MEVYKAKVLTEALNNAMIMLNANELDSGLVSRITRVNDMLVSLGSRCGLHSRQIVAIIIEQWERDLIRP